VVRAILRVPFSVIASIILVICAIGAFTVNNSEFDILVMLVFGLIGYVLKKLDYPLAPLVLALVLGDRTEEAFRQSLPHQPGRHADLLPQLAVGLDHGGGLALALWPVLGAVLAEAGGGRGLRRAACGVVQGSAGVKVRPG
jgi:TctA family transporter